MASEPFRRTFGVLALAGLLAGCGQDAAPRVSAPASTAVSSTSPGEQPSAPAATLSTSLPRATPAPSPSAPSPSAPSPSAPSTSPPPAPPPEPARPAGALPLGGVVVVVDPGHNGANAEHPAQVNALVDAGGLRKPCNATGTANARQSEADFTWALAQRVRADLQAAGATVVLTRDSNDGWGPCIDERGRKAQQAGAQVLVSLHADGAPASAHGFHVIHPSPLAAQPGGAQVSPEVAQSSRALAASLRDSLRDKGFATSTYLGQDGLDRRGDLGTLNWARVPAVMLEAGNMANAADAARLASDEGQEQIAQAVTAAVAAQVHR